MAVAFEVIRKSFVAARRKPSVPLQRNDYVDWFARLCVKKKFNEEAKVCGYGGSPDGSRHAATMSASSYYRT